MDMNEYAENPMQEKLMGRQVERQADGYLKRYKSHIELLESKSLLSKIRTVSPYDIYSLGKQLESFEIYRDLCEEEGTLAQLGKIPNIALDVITVAYGNSPISAFASIQPIDEEIGTVYYKTVIAQTTRGNVTKGDQIANATLMEQTFPFGYASDTQTATVAVTTDAVLDYSIVIPNQPLRPYKCGVTIGNVTCTDNGEGKLIGYNLQGTVDYVTGACELQLRVNPGAGVNIVAVTAQDFESADDIPKIIMKLTTKSVSANVFALKDTIGLEQSYALRRRFGMVADDEVAADLVAAINSEVVGTAIHKLRSVVTEEVTFDKTAPTGVSYQEHKLDFKDSIAEAESVILGKSGKGTVSVLIAGRNAASMIGTLPGFNKISDGTTIGPHIYGSLDGMMVIRVPNAQVLPADEVLCVYNSGSPFESALVYAPYMPLVVTTAMPTGANPLMNQKAAAVWAAIDVLVTNFVTRIRIVAT